MTANAFSAAFGEPTCGLRSGQCGGQPLGHTAWSQLLERLVQKLDPEHSTSLHILIIVNEAAGLLLSPRLPLA